MLKSAIHWLNPYQLDKYNNYQVLLSYLVDSAFHPVNNWGQTNININISLFSYISPQNFILLPRQFRKGWSWNKVYTIKQKRKINKCITLLCNNYCFFISWNELLSTGICLTKLVYTVDLCWSHKNFYFVFSFLLRILLWLLQEGLGPLLYKNMSSSNLNLSSPKICTPKLNFWLLPTMSSSMN